MHLDLDDAVALAGLAAAALDVERETARLVAARLGLGQAGKPVADRREGAGIGRRVGARRAPDRRLIDVDYLVENSEALESRRERPPGCGARRSTGARAALYSVSMISVDLPLPDTPVTQVKVPSGISAVMF